MSRGNKGEQQPIYHPERRFPSPNRKKMEAVVGFGLLLPLLLLLLGLTVVGQEAVELFNFHEPSHAQPFFHNNSPPTIAVSVSEAELEVVSSSVILAERWLRSHVLAHFPSKNITAIIVGKGVLCSIHHERRWGLVLPSVRNLHYSLVRWGLVREIQVSVAFSSDCLDHHPSSSRFRGHPSERILKPILSFLKDHDSLYTIDTRLHSFESTNLVVLSHKYALGELGFPQLRLAVLKEASHLNSRKLSSSFISSPYPEKPKPTAIPPPAGSPQSPVQLPQSPSGSPQFASAPDGSFSFVPAASPSEIPDNPPDSFSLPPSSCMAPPTSAPGPATTEWGKQGLWCVAKPAVPTETLQEGIDYACGEGGADCEEIKPDGSCYFPDNVVAHASYAFNSYWQKTKRTGGSCGFGGTAILVNSDPSFLHCRFVLN